MIDLHGIARLDIICPYCGCEYNLTLGLEDVLDLYDGLLVDEVFPYDSASSREHLISGLCTDCQEKLFKEL